MQQPFGTYFKEYAANNLHFKCPSINEESMSSLWSCVQHRPFWNYCWQIVKCSRISVTFHISLTASSKFAVTVRYYSERITVPPGIFQSRYRKRFAFIRALNICRQWLHTDDLALWCIHLKKFAQEESWLMKLCTANETNIFARIMNNFLFASAKLLRKNVLWQHRSRVCVYVYVFAGEFQLEKHWS